MGVSLLTGICFTVGVLLVLLAKDIYVEKSAEEETWVDTPDGVVISSHEIKDSAPRFTIVGEIHNSSPYDWKTIWIDVAVYAGSALVNTCDDSFRHIPAQSSKPFEVQCYDVSGSNLPDNVSYEVLIKSGRR